MLLASTNFGGADRNRTDDLMLAKHALSQLSYGPEFDLTMPAVAARRRSLVGPGRVERPTSRLSGVRSNHLSYEPKLNHAATHVPWTRVSTEGRETKGAAGMPLSIDFRETA